MMFTRKWIDLARGSEGEEEEKPGEGEDYQGKKGVRWERARATKRLTPVPKYNICMNEDVIMNR